MCQLRGAGECVHFVFLYEGEHRQDASACLLLASIKTYKRCDGIPTSVILITNATEEFFKFIYLARGIAVAE
jgi:hypothetical protein